MSRTYRRKNYEVTQGTSWDRQGRKFGGFYTTWDFEWNRNGGRGYYNYRPMTKLERYDKNRLIHGESVHGNAWSPGRHYRKYREDQHRMRCKQEIIKYRKNPDYDPIIYDNPIDCWCDWS